MDLLIMPKCSTGLLTCMRDINSTTRYLKYKRIPIAEDLPFDAMGSYTGLNYNYNTLTTTLGPLIWNARVSKMTMMGDFERLNTDVFSAFVDFELQTVRVH